MMGSDVIQYILLRHYPFETLQEALSLRLVSKRMSKVITARPRLNDVFWARYFEYMECMYQIPSDTWLRIHKYVKVDLNNIALLYKINNGSSRRCTVKKTILISVLITKVGRV